MTSAAKAVFGFFSSFGLPAYLDTSVPDNAALPYITYSCAVADWSEESAISASVWYPGTSYAPVFAKVDEIEKALTKRNIIKTEDGGYIAIHKGTPFAQTQDTGDSTCKAAYMNFNLMSLTI